MVDVESRPLLRGWIHAAAVPAVVAAVVLLALRARSPEAVASAAVFAVSAVTLFTVSAVYHLGRWSPPVRLVLRSVDHADILFLIAGTYTPFAVLALRGSACLAVLGLVWAAAALGAVFRIAWTSLPRWVYVPLYAGVGWTAVFVFRELLDGAGVAAVCLVVAGGAVYTAGAVAYGVRRPNPWPGVFGFHEVFHACTVVAFACQYAAVLILIGRS